MAENKENTCFFYYLNNLFRMISVVWHAVLIIYFKQDENVWLIRGDI